MLRDCCKSRRQLEAEILVLRHQLNVLRQRAPRRLYLSWADRALFIWLYRGFPRILEAIIIVRPETVVRWHRMGFAAYWRWKSRPLGGRPRIGKEVRDLIRRMSFENPLWGAVIPENFIRADSRVEGESGHHLARCLPCSICLGRLSPTCSNRGAGLKSRTSFFGISSILPCGVHRTVCGCVGVTGHCWYG